MSRGRYAVDFTGTVEEKDSQSNCDEDVETSVSSATTKQTSATFPRSKSDIESAPADTSTVDEEEPTLTSVVGLDAYAGDNLEEKVDSFTRAHPVVMFSKSWCLFSIDAQDFLIHGMKVSLHCLEVDTHPHGKEILKFVQEMTKHDTVPVIFIKGKFLGGFEDVNVLYASGKLQNEYLTDLTQADQCEEILTKSNMNTQPLFWFPETVNAHVVRVTGILTCLMSAFSAIVVHWAAMGRFVAYGMFLDFVLRLFGGSRVSLLGRIAILLTYPLEPKTRHGRPKQFATMCGCMFSGLATLFYLISFPCHDYVGTAFMGGLAVASGMEGFFDFCLGCVFFKYGIKLGLIRK